jgi:integrase
VREPLGRALQLQSVVPGERLEQPGSDAHPQALPHARGREVAGAEATVALNRGEMRAPSTVRLREAGEAWLVGARDGTIRNRSGDAYKLSVIRSYEASFRRRLLPNLGAMRLADIRRSDVQDLADRLLAEGLDPSSIRNALMPLRVIFRRAVGRGEIAVNPCDRIQLPAVKGRRERIASPDEAARLVATVPDRDRGMWATALYGGLRRGELMALLWTKVDLATGVIRVERSWDPKERATVATKSRGGRRRVPMAGALRRHLLEHRLLTGSGEGLVFGRTPVVPFDPPPAPGPSRRGARPGSRSGCTNAVTPSRAS